MGDPLATRIMTEGLELEFLSPPPMVSACPPHLYPSPAQLLIIRRKVLDLVERGIVREILVPQPLFFSRLFLVPKGEDHRLIIDLSELNKLLIVPTFRMERVVEIAAGITESMWGVTLDIQDAYWHVPVSWLCHVFLAFSLELFPGVWKTFVFQYLPFGLSSAPWAFTRVMKPIKAYLHIRSIRAHSYLDDFLFLSRCREVLVEQIALVLNLLERLGLKINSKKSQLVLSQ